MKIRELCDSVAKDCEKIDLDKTRQQVNEESCLNAFRGLKALIMAHAKAEEYTLYSLFEDNKAQSYQALQHFSLEGYEEHDLIDRLLKEMGQAEEVTAKWRAQLTVLTELLDHHLREEEQSFFPKVQVTVAQEQLLALGETYSRERDQIFMKKGGLGHSSALNLKAEKSLVHH